MVPMYATAMDRYTLYIRLWVIWMVVLFVGGVYWLSSRVAY